MKRHYFTPILIALIIVAICLGGCDIIAQNSRKSVSQNVESSEDIGPDLLESEPTVDSISTEQVILEANGIRITQAGALYYCYFYNQHQKIIRTEGPFNKSPSVLIIKNNLIRVFMQGGTGIGTQWSLFYDYVRGFFSEVFTGVFDQNQGNIAYATQNKVIIQDIFAESEYYVEIEAFDHTLSPVAEPIKDVAFLNNGKRVIITYLTGLNCREVYDIIELQRDE